MPFRESHAPIHINKAMNKVKGLINLLAFVFFMLFLLMVNNNDTEVGSYEPQTSSWLDNLLGNDDTESIGGGGGYDGGFSLTSIFAGIEFRFKVKDYRAWNDDDLSEADDGL